VVLKWQKQVNDPFANLPNAQPELLGSSPKKGSKGRGDSSEPCPTTLAEARLLKAYYRDPRGGVYYRQKIRWMREARDFSQWPKSVVTERRMRLQKDWQTLMSLLDASDEQLTALGWDGKKYWAMWQRSRSWLGQIHGLDEAMANRREM
jgi:hypothetical protein